MWALQEARIYNFRLLKDCELSLGHSGLVHVGAVNKDLPHSDSNESGKSTLLHAICWNLYGCDTLGNPFTDKVVSFGETTCNVHLTFTDTEKDTRITVYRERNNKPNRGAGEQTNTLIVRCFVKGNNSVAFDEAAQQLVISQFGHKDLFLAAHIFGYEEGYVPFARKPEREQKNLFEQLIENDDLLSALERTGLERKKTEHIIRNAERKIHRLTGWIKGAVSQLKESQEEVNQEELEKEIDHLTLLDRELKDRVDSSFDKLSEQQDIVRELSDKKYELEAKIAEIALPLENATNRVRGLKEKIHDLDLVTVCPTCNHLIRTVAERKAIKAEAERSLRTAKEELSELKQRVDTKALTLEIGVLDNRVEDETSRATSLQQRHEKHLKDYQRLCNELSVKQELLKQVKERSSQRAAQLAQRVSAQRSELGVIRELSDEEQDRLQDLAFWEEGFGHKGMRAYRLDNLTPTLNEIAFDYSMELFGNGTHVEYTTQKRTKAGELRDRFAIYLVDKDGTHLEDLSAGQAMRRDLIHLFSTISLATKLGRRKLDFLAFDETFRTLDRLGKEAVMRILQDMSMSVDTILVLEHDLEMQSHFDKGLTVTREHGKADISWN